MPLGEEWRENQSPPAVVLRKDGRFRVTPEIAWRALRLRPGAHRVVVKFLASAAPFRVALVPAAPETRQRDAHIDYAPEAAYVAAALKYWAGDYNGVISDLDGAKTRGSAAVDFLRYKAWTHVAEDSPEAPAMLNATLQAAPTAIAAEYELASRAFAADRTDEALSRLQRVISTREHFLPGQQLLADIATRLNWPVLSEKALDIQLRAHPSCEVLLQGYKFFAGHARYERSHELRRRLADCAPDTLAYERSLRESGEHQRAAAVLETTVARRPLDRGARELLIRELILSGQPEKARTAAQELAYAQSHFFLPHRARDPFHTIAVSTESFVSYDAYDLLMVETRDALGNRVTVGERRLEVVWTPGHAPGRFVRYTDGELGHRL